MWRRSGPATVGWPPPLRRPLGSQRPQTPARKRHTVYASACSVEFQRTDATLMQPTDRRGCRVRGTAYLHRCCTQASVSSLARSNHATGGDRGRPLQAQYLLCCPVSCCCCRSSASGIGHCSIRGDTLPNHERRDQRWRWRRVAAGKQLGARVGLDGEVLAAVLVRPQPTPEQSIGWKLDYGFRCNDGAAAMRRRPAPGFSAQLWST